MKTTSRGTLIAALLFGSAITYGQTPDACPSISVIGPAGVTKPGDKLNFDVKLSPEKYDNLSYQWFVSAGTILKGQGKSWIVVQTETNGFNYNVTATVEISGLPSFCIRSASETAPVGDGDPIVVDEFARTTPLREQIERFKIAATEARENDQILFVIEYFRRGTSASAIQKRLRWISDNLVRTGKLRPSDFQTVTSISPSDIPPRTRIYRIPRDAEPPLP